MSRKKELLTLMNIDVSWLNDDVIGKNILSFEDLKLDADNCQKCILAKTRNKVVFGKGNNNSQILIIGEAPGKEEDLTAEPFVGRAGKLLTEILLSIKLTRAQDLISSLLEMMYILRTQLNVVHLKTEIPVMKKLNLVQVIWINKLN